MKLAEAKEKLRPFIGVKFAELMKDKNIDDIIVNKGKTGQLLEILLGMKNTSAKLDFEDGELKTNKCKSLGQPMETMFIMQVMSVIDELCERKDFYTTDLYKKIDHILYVPIFKDNPNPREWYIIDVLDVAINTNPDLKEIKEQLEKDYYTICDKVINDIATKGRIHTSSGKYIQIRTKDSKPYHPIKSNGKEVSNKNYAFYFKKEFMIAIVKILRGAS